MVGLNGELRLMDFYGAGRSEKDLRSEERLYQKAGYDWPPRGRLHTCDVCKNEQVWGPGWMTYGSIEDTEGKYRGYTVVQPPQPEKIVTTCSNDCRQRAIAKPIKGKHRIPKNTYM